jgi:RNA polymerase sigma-70 factor (ECF subfamily)
MGMPDKRRPRSPSDETLMKRFYAGDDAALEHLQARHDRGLRAFFARRLRPAVDVDDLCQHVWVKILATRQARRAASDPRFDPTRRFRPWLYRIAHNELVTFWRKSARIRANERPLEHALSAPAPSHDPYLEAERALALRACRESLSEPESTVLLLAAQGLTLADIGALFGRDTTWAFRTRRRAIHHIADCLRARGFES